MKKLVFAALFAVAAHAVSGPVGGFKSPKVVSVADPRLNIQGDVLYHIRLDPFRVADLDKEASALGYARPVPVGAARSALDWHQPGVRLALDRLASKHYMSVQEVSSWGALAITAYLSADVVDRVALEDLVVRMDQIPKSSVVLSQAFGDVVSGGEIIPWGKISVNANDGLTTSNNLYIIDAILGQPTLTEMNIIFRSDEGSPHSTYVYHPTHVAGIIGAKSNNALIRGINPNQPIGAFGVDVPNATESSIPGRIDVAIYVAETINDFATMNISMNSSWGIPQLNIFNHNESVGRRLRAASNRFFITQSAGNNYADACNYSFQYAGAPRSNDGIMVVGGIAYDGSRMTGGTDPIGGVENYVHGSNDGPCVEIWAPAHQVTSVAPNGGVRISTGTSYAAPIAAAIASRYGNSQTRPIEREGYLVANAMPTPYSSSGLPINKAYYAKPGAPPVRGRLPIVGAASTTSSVNLASVYDGKFSDLSYGYWNAGANSGTITVDLGSIRTVTGVRLTLRSSVPDTPVNFTLHGGTSSISGPFTTIRTWTEPSQDDLAPVYIPVSSYSARYLKIDGSNSYSWLAYSEIEVYGY